MSPFGGSGAYQISNSLHFPLLKIASDSWVCALRERSMCKEECYPLLPMA
ncbi:hypothetical protein HMPREF9078_01357 [Capnocytophaga sp. oral taxon 380 str. F0488]|nr:hypothetical protein HMPREF9078_01357 [Capnocytophaga sp. oral taxon 380 str. F0488]